MTTTGTSTVEVLREVIAERDRLRDIRPLTEQYRRVHHALDTMRRVGAAFQVEYTTVGSLTGVQSKLDSACGAVVAAVARIEDVIEALTRECLRELDQRHPEAGREYAEDAQALLAMVCPDERAGITRMGDHESQIIREGDDMPDGQAHGVATSAPAEDTPAEGTTN